MHLDKLTDKNSEEIEQVGFFFTQMVTSLKLTISRLFLVIP